MTEMTTAPTEARKRYRRHACKQPSSFQVPVAPPPPPKPGKPATKYTPELARRICARLIGGDSLSKICKEAEFPNKDTVINWLADPARDDFREFYYYARQMQAHGYIDDIVDIADDTSNDWEPVYNSDGELIDTKPNTEAIQRSRVRIDTRKWIAIRMLPRIYGDKFLHEHDATGELAELLKKVSNRDDGLPPPIEHE